MNDCAWFKTNLGSLVEINSRVINSNYPQKVINYIDTGSVTRNVFDTPQLLPVGSAPSRAKRLVKQGDTIISTVRPIQRHYGYINDPVENLIVSTGFVVVTPKEIDPKFLYYVLTQDSITEYLNQIAESSATAYPGFTPTLINNLEIFIPKGIPEQRAIADVLSALDDKIDLNRRMNQTLEELAQTLFKHWLIDYPDEGWVKKPLDEIALFLNGLALQKYPPKGGEYLPVIKIAQLRTNHSEGADKAGVYLDPEYIVNDGDVLFSWSGSLTVILWCGGKGALNQHLFKVTSDTYPKWFYYYWIKHHLPDFQAIAEGKATTMGHIQRHHLHEAIVIVPDQKTLAGLTESIEPIIDKIIANNIESRTLAELRDTLLPRLMSGQVWVKAT